MSSSGEEVDVAGEDVREGAFGGAGGGGLGAELPQAQIGYAEVPGGE